MCDVYEYSTQDEDLCMMITDRLTCHTCIHIAHTLLNIDRYKLHYIEPGEI